jgi:hypothetical protein
VGAHVVVIVEGQVRAAAPAGPAQADGLLHLLAAVRAAVVVERHLLAARHRLRGEQTHLQWEVID